MSSDAASDQSAADGYLQRAQLLAELGRYDEAVGELSSLIATDPGNAEALTMLARTHLATDRSGEALDAAEAAVSAAMDPARSDAGRTNSDGLRRLVLYGAGWSLVAAVLVAFLAPAGPGLSRAVAVVATLGGALVVWRYAARMPGPLGTFLPGLLRADRGLALAVYAVAAAPVLLVLYALVGGLWPLVASITVAMVAEFAVLSRTVR